MIPPGCLAPVADDQSTMRILTGEAEQQLRH